MSPFPLATTGREYRGINMNASLRNLHKQTLAANIGIPPVLAWPFAGLLSKRIRERSGFGASREREARFGSRSRLVPRPARTHNGLTSSGAGNALVHHSPTPFSPALFSVGVTE